jgi:dTDP-4-amino-4,6-dideoxygalactose transaminase
MQVPLLDLKAQYAQIRDEVRPVIDEVCEQQAFILGPKVEELEKAVASYCGVPSACGVSSGSDALLMSLMLAGVGPGDEVITTPYTFFATAGAVHRVGATSVFVDIDPRTYNIDPARIEAAVTAHTRAIIPVHLYGQAADMDPILDIARRHDLFVVEDAAQAIGAEYRGRRVGCFGDCCCFSFFPSKNLGGFGDGGMIVSANADMQHELLTLRNHGMAPAYHHAFVGGNFRLDALQAAVLTVKLRYLDRWTEQRQLNGDRYRDMFAACEAADQIQLPYVADTATRHVHNQFVVRLPAAKRQAVWDGLREAGIGCNVYYPVPLHLQECFAYLGHARGDFPESERAAAETLAIPIYAELTPDQQQHVVDTISRLLLSRD